MYSKEEIERKRLEALKRKQQKISSPINSPTPNNSTTRSVFGIFTNQNQSSNASISSTNKNFGTDFSNKSLQNKSPRVFKQQGVSNRYNPVQSTNNFYGNQPMCEATCIMLSSSRFVIETSHYNQNLIETLKTIPTRHYDVQSKMWDFHIYEYELVKQKIDLLKKEVIFNPIPKFVLNVFKNALSKEKEPKQTVNISQIDNVLVNSLYPFQKEGIEFGILCDGKCLIADDMGLGKTRQALGIASYFKKDWPLLIVAPSSVKYQWSEAIVESLPSVLVQSIQHVTTTKDYIEKCQVTIISYDLLARRIDEISAKKFGVVICDESHYLKSSKTQRTKAVQQLVSTSSRVILLTGTPALSRPIEFYPQIKLVMPFFMGYKEFGVRYCAGVQGRFGWDFSGSSNLKELEMLLKNCCLLRRLKSEVMTQLPTKIRQKVILDPHLIKKATEEMKAASKKLEESSEHGLKNHSILLEYYSASSKAKEKAVCNYIAELLENQQKFIVFAHHQNMLDGISNLLDSKKIRFIRIDGKTNPEQRKYFVDQFQQNSKTLAAVLSITAANAGITLTAAKIVIFAELSWNPGILRQAEDRAHRIGQTENVAIRYLIAKETVDDYLWLGIQKKIDVLNEVGLDQNFDLNNADIENQRSSAFKSQPKIDNFLTPPTKDSASLSNMEPSGNADLSSGNFKELLDMDDDAFENIDLDELENE